MLSTDQLAAIGAFLSGVGSALTAAWFVRRQHREAERDCKERLESYKQALHEGIDIAQHDK